MINQNNPFYGSAGFTPMPGTSYAPQNGNYVTQSQTYQNPYIQQPNRFQSIPGRNTGNGNLSGFGRGPNTGNLL